MKLDGCPAFDLAANVTFYAHINLACTAHSTLLLKSEVLILQQCTFGALNNPVVAAKSIAANAAQNSAASAA